MLLVTEKIIRRKKLVKGFHLNGYTTGSHPQPQKLQLYTKFISPCESTPANIIQSGQTLGVWKTKFWTPSITHPSLLTWDLSRQRQRGRSCFRSKGDGLEGIFVNVLLSTWWFVWCTWKFEFQNSLSSRPSDCGDGANRSEQENSELVGWGRVGGFSRSLTSHRTPQYERLGQARNKIEFPMIFLQIDTLMIKYSWHNRLKFDRACSYVHVAQLACNWMAIYTNQLFFHMKFYKLGPVYMEVGDPR